MSDHDDGESEKECVLSFLQCVFAALQYEKYRTKQIRGIAQAQLFPVERSTTI